MEKNFADSLTDFGREHIAQLNKDTVIECRNAFIRGWLNRGATYTGRLNSADVALPTHGPDLHGDEI